MRCVQEHARVCGKDVAYLSDIFSDVLSQIFQTNLLKEVMNEEEIKSLISYNSLQQVKNQIDTIQTNLLDTIKAGFEKLEKKVIEFVDESTLREVNFNKLKEILDFQRIKDVLSSGMKDLENLSIIKNQDEIFVSLLKLKQEKIDTINKGEKIKKLYNALEDVQNLFRKTFSVYVDEEPLYKRKKMVNLDLNSQSAYFYVNERTNDSYSFLESENINFHSNNTYR